MHFRAIPRIKEVRQMDIDIENETLITLAEAAARLPKRPSICTMHRWCQSGVRDTVLASVFICGLMYTSVEALRRFLAAASRTRTLPQTPPPTHDVTRRRLEIERRLRSKGI